MQLHFARASKIAKQRLALLSAFVAATSLSLVVVSYGSAGSPKAEPGYWLATSSGTVSAFGGARQFGSLKTPGSSAVVGIAPTADGGGYWLATANGQVHAFGDARLFGSMAARPLAKPIVGITGTPDGRGYWLLGGDGGVFTFGDARFMGSAGPDHLRSAVVAMVVPPAGRGYWLATKDGGILRFGDVPFGPAKLTAPVGSAVVGMAATPAAKGYWLVTAKGKVLAFGDAHNYGSMDGARLKAAIVGIAPTADGKGYWLAARDGGVFAFGDARFMGSQLGGAIAGHHASPSVQQWTTGIALSFSAGKPSYNTGHGATTTGATPTTTHPTRTTTAAPATASGNCTKPVWSTSAATGTDNIDSAGRWWIDNDAWSGTHGPQTLHVCNESSWYAVSQQPNVQGQVETYPDTEYDVGGRNALSTKPISAYNSITSSFSEDFPAAGSWDAAYDLWLNNWGTEIMVWNQWTGTQLYWPGPGARAVTLDGVPYHFINNGGELVFTRDKMVKSGSVDLLAAMEWLVSQGLVKSTDVPTQLEYGVEICSTSGPETFPMTGLKFNLS